MSTIVCLEQHVFPFRETLFCSLYLALPTELGRGLEGIERGEKKHHYCSLDFPPIAFDFSLYLLVLNFLLIDNVNSLSYYVKSLKLMFGHVIFALPLCLSFVAMSSIFCMLNI